MGVTRLEMSNKDLTNRRTLRLCWTTRDHPDYEKHYDEIGNDIDVHGGLTFAGYWEEFHDSLVVRGL